jgi:hypothetical protein
MKRLRTIIPPKRIQEEFRLTYELKGAQRAVNFLANYYGIRRMKIVIDGRRVGKKSWDACYYDNVGYFRRNKINKNLFLHEFYHHLVCAKKLDISETKEEREANTFEKKSATTSITSIFALLSFGSEHNSISILLRQELYPEGKTTLDAFGFTKR